jgi:hypothetical protein
VLRQEIAYCSDLDARDPEEVADVIGPLMADAHEPHADPVHRIHREEGRRGQRWAGRRCLRGKTLGAECVAGADPGRCGSQKLPAVEVVRHCICSGEWRGAVRIAVIDERDKVRRRVNG